MLISGERRTAHFRAAERRVIQVDAAVQFVGARSQGDPFPVRVLNVGLGGVGVAGVMTVREEDRVTVYLMSPHLLDPLALPARVAWVQVQAGHPMRYAGLAFEGPAPSSLLTLFQLIGSLSG